MTVTPTGPISLPLFYLAETIAASTTFQSFVGAASATEAKAKILEFWGDERDVSESRPRCIIEFADRKVTKQSTTGWETTPSLLMMFERDVPEAHKSNHRDARTDFSNLIGAIEEEMQQLITSGTGGYLNIIDFEGPEIIGFDDDDAGDLFMAGLYMVQYQG